MLSNIEVIVGDFECMDDVVLPENMDTIIHAGARTHHFAMMMNLKSKCSRYC